MSHEKLIRDGMVGIVYSPGFGAGWSSWGKPWMATDKRIVECVEAGADVVALATQIAHDEHSDDYVCTLGSGDLRVQCLPKGTAFRIHEYDGYESVETADVLDQVA